MPNQLTEHNYICKDIQRGEIHSALIKEYEALCDRSNEQKIKLYNGILQQIIADKYIYKFALPKEPERILEPDKPYILSIDGITIKGGITAIPQDRSEVEIELYENKGKIIPALDIIIDLKVLIDLIDRRIVAIDREPNSFKTTTAAYLFNPTTNIQSSNFEKKLDHKNRTDRIPLSDEQIASITRSLTHKLSVVWGPPGTGKTKTLQGIIAELLTNGQKILFVSNTNYAIDGLLKDLINESPYRIFDELKNEGKILRIGSQTNTEVKEVFGSREVAQQKSKEIQSEINDLQFKIEKEQSTLNKVQKEIKDLDRANFIQAEIERIAEKIKSIPNSSDLKQNIFRLDYAKGEIIRLIRQSRQVISDVKAIDIIVENLENQKIKVTGLNTLLFKTEQSIKNNENEILIITNKISTLEKAFLSVFRYKKSIEELQKNKESLNLKIADHKRLLETYKFQQASEVDSQTLLMGKFKNLLIKINKIAIQSNIYTDIILTYFSDLDIRLYIDKKKPSWILLGEENSIINENQGDAINIFILLSNYDEDIIENQFVNVTQDINNKIESNEKLRKSLEDKLNEIREELESYNDILSKSQSYWEKIKEKEQNIHKTIEVILSQLNPLLDKLKNIEKNIIKEANLLCCTMVKASYDEILAGREFDSLVVDETSMVLLPQLYCSSALIKDKIILCGDHLQLQPISISESKIALKWLASSYYDLIEFNGELEDESNDDTHEIIDDNKDAKKKRRKNRVKRATSLKRLSPFLSMLTYQHRMPTSIANLVRLWYSKNQLTLIDVWKSENYDHLKNCLDDHFLSSDYNIFFINTSSIRTYHSRTSDNSPYNLINAAIVAEIVRELVEEYKVDVKKIRCLSPYRAQYQLTTALLFKFLSDKFHDKLPNIATSVHKIQGGEAPIIFYDLTDGCQGSSFTGFIRTDDFHIHNVAISRSQFKLIFVGDLDKIKKLKETHPNAALYDVLKQILKTARIVNAKPYKDKIFKQFTEKDLIQESLFTFDDEKNRLIILNSQLYFKFLENDIHKAKYSLLFISPFITKARWMKLMPAFKDFIMNTNGNGTITIITRPPDKMFSGNQVNMSVVEVLNQFVNLGYKVLLSSKLHSKLVVIDRGTLNAIAYWGSLNPLSFNDTEEINTRLTNKEIAEQLVNMSLVGSIYPYNEVSIDEELLYQHTLDIVKKQFNDFRWTLAGYYGRPFFAICSNETVEMIIKILPISRSDFKKIPQFNRLNFVLWNHLSEIQEIISPLREFQKKAV